MRFVVISEPCPTCKCGLHASHARPTFLEEGIKSLPSENGLAPSARQTFEKFVVREVGARATVSIYFNEVDNGAV